MTFSPTRVLPSVAVVAVLVLAGCSSPSGSLPGRSAPSRSMTFPPPTASSSPGGLATTCLTAAAVSTDVGSPYPAPEQNSGGGQTQCVYSDDSGDTNLDYTIEPSDGLSASLMKTGFKNEVQALGVSTVTDVNGLGNAAFQYVLNPAGTAANHVTATTVRIMVGSQLVTITGTVTPAGALALARSILG